MPGAEAIAVLITGASGFVGRNLVRTMLARGEEVVAFASSIPGWRDDASAGLRFIMGDVRSADDVRRAFQVASIDKIVHAAAVTPDSKTEAESPETVIEVNVGGTTQLMQAAHREGVPRVLALSSVAAYGAALAEADSTLDEETTPPRPISLYGITKLAAEGVVRRLGELHGIATTTVRLGPCFGVGEYPNGLRPVLSPHWQCAEAALTGQECVLPRVLQGDWIDVEDATRAIADLLASASPLLGPFNLGGGTTTTVAAWCEALGSVRPGFSWSIDAAAPTVRHGLASDRPAMCNRRLRDVIGWAPETGDLPGRAERYLEWRGSAEGRKLCENGG